MPKITVPETFDQWVGVALRNAARKKGLTQVDLAKVIGASDKTFTRRMAGNPGFTVDELRLLCAEVGVKTSAIVREALADFGTPEDVKDEMLAEQAVSDLGDKNAEPDELARRRKHAAAAALPAEHLEDRSRHLIAATDDPERATDEPPTA